MVMIKLKKKTQRIIVWCMLIAMIASVVATIVAYAVR